MIVRVLWKPALWVVVVFAACIAVIRAQPPDDGELQTVLLASPGCEDAESPCLMGVLPDSTFVDPALEALQNHAWVASVGSDEPFSRNQTTRGIAWRWAAPPEVVAAEGGQLYLSQRSNNRRVEEIWIEVNATMEDVLVALGLPGRVEYVTLMNGQLVYLLMYHRYGIVVMVEAGDGCGVNPMTLLVDGVIFDTDMRFSDAPVLMLHETLSICKLMP